MLLLVNGREVDVPEGVTVAMYVAQNGLTPDRIIVEHNAEIIKREIWDEVVLKPADKLEILTFVGGG